MLISIADHNDDILKFLGGVIGIVIIYRIVIGLIKKFGKKDNPVLVFKDKLILSLPVVGELVKNYNLFLISGFSSALIRVGTPFDMILITLQNTINNSYYYVVLGKILERIGEGEKLSKAFLQSKAFPNMFVRYLIVGENTGDLDNKLEYLSHLYLERLERTLKTLPKVIEPVMLIVAGGLMLLMIIAVFVPIYSSISKIIGE
jgi:type II secretory pathway component PulF